MILYQKIMSMSLKDLANFLVRPGYESSSDYEFDGEEEHLVEISIDGFTTSDGTFFIFEDTAVEYQIELLQSEYKVHPGDLQKNS